MGLDRLLRVDNWPSAMYAAIEEKRNQPFIWGSSDCCLFVADIIEAMTGIDIATGLRGKYDSLESAEIILNGPLVEFMDRAMKFYNIEEIPLSYAGRGDMVVFNSTLGQTLGILDGTQIISMGYEGIVMAPRGEAFKAWRI